MDKAVSVTQITSYIKSVMDRDYMLKRVYVKGEISNLKYHSSGHIYFTLKDQGASIKGAMFANARAGLKFKLEDGMSVIVEGRISVYEPAGTYQLYANSIIMDGIGELYVKYEQLKRELEEMGMFADEYKQEIPRFAKTIGVVTAETGAAVRDIISVSKRRNPYVQIILYPAQVQGDGSAESVARGIRVLDEYGVDTIIVGRGGGSIEDLWAFNERIVAEAIFNCRTPVISAVGHETDYTIADFVADKRAATPSAAAELANYVYADLLYSFDNCGREMNSLMRERVNDYRRICSEYLGKIKLYSPQGKLDYYRQRMDGLEDRLQGRMNSKLSDSRSKLDVYIEKLRGLSPLDKLNQGFSYVADSKGRVVNSVEAVKAGETIEVDVRDGRIMATVTDTSKVEWN